MGSGQTQAATSTTAMFVLALSLFSEGVSSQLAPERSVEVAAAEGGVGLLRAQLELATSRLEEIRAEESAAGPNSETLIDMFRSLALLYEEMGEHELAAESVERALHIQRVNHGLNSSGQIPILRQLLAMERSRGAFGGLQEHEARLLRLARTHSDDLSTFEIFREAGDRIYRHYLESGSPSKIDININAFAAGPPMGHDPQSAAGSLWQARGHYLEALAVILRNGVYDHEALREIERMLVSTYHLELTEGRSDGMGREALHHHGRNSLQRVVAYELHGGGSRADFATALVDLGDWELLFSRHSSAFARYREAYELLAEHEETKPLIQELFAPETPVAIPGFLSSPLQSNETRSFTGHIDVAFELTKYGRSRRIRVLDVSGDAAEAPERDVVRLIAGNRYRPHLVDGEATRTSVILRYHY
jgi:tetratricopeptide (TPR) repeat protein